MIWTMDITEQEMLAGRHLKDTIDMLDNATSLNRHSTKHEDIYCIQRGKDSRRLTLLRSSSSNFSSTDGSSLVM